MGSHWSLILVHIRLTAHYRKSFLLAVVHHTSIIMRLLRATIVKVHVIRRLRRSLLNWRWRHVREGYYSHRWFKICTNLLGCRNPSRVHQAKRIRTLVITLGNEDLVNVVVVRLEEIVFCFSMNIMNSWHFLTGLERCIDLLQIDWLCTWGARIMKFVNFNYASFNRF